MSRRTPAKAATPAPVAYPAEPQASTGRPSVEELQRLVGGAHHNPHSLLGAHPSATGLVIRALRPDAEHVTALVGGERFAMAELHPAVWEVHLPGSPVVDYRLEVGYQGDTYLADDPYRYLATLGEMDLHLISEGRHEDLWTVLGAHLRSYDAAAGTVTGTSFAVWAPNARGVRVIGEFNGWVGRAHRTA